MMDEAARTKGNGTGITPISRVGVLLGLIVLSGCSGPQDPVSPTDGLSSLVDWKACPWTYPDGRPVDCGFTNAVAPEPMLSGNWVCLDQLTSLKSTVRLLTDLQGRYALEYNSTGSGKDYGRVHLTDREGKTQMVNFGGPTSGFVRFPDTAANDGKWRVIFYEFTVGGSPSMMNTQNLVVRMGEFANNKSQWGYNPWFLLVISDGPNEYYFQKMDKSVFEELENWVPGSFDLVGQDFRVVVSTDLRMHSFSTYSVPYSFLGIPPRSCNDLPSA